MCHHQRLHLTLQLTLTLHLTLTLEALRTLFIPAFAEFNLKNRNFSFLFCILYFILPSLICYSKIKFSTARLHVITIFICHPSSV